MNCDRALAVAHSCRGSVAGRPGRINQLEREADGLLDRLLAEAKSNIAKVQSEADARVNETKREADERIARLLPRLKITSVACSTSSHNPSIAPTRSKPKPTARIERTKLEVKARLPDVEAQADERIASLITETEDRFGSLQDELAKPSRMPVGPKPRLIWCIERIEVKADAGLRPGRSRQNNCIDLLQAIMGGIAAST